MEDWEKINAVDRMQKYIISHIDEEITLQNLSRTAGYSLWHSIKIFKELLYKTPFEYIRAARLTKAAKELRDSGTKVLDTALDNGFNSHDGFTKAFAKQFSLTPQKYRNEKPPVSYFTYYPIRDYYLYTITAALKTTNKNEAPTPQHRQLSELNNDMFNCRCNNKRDDEEMKNGFPSTVTVQQVERPARKLILLRSQTATDYFSYCEENGCDWEGLLNSIPEKFDNAAILELPEQLVTDGTSACAAGVEVPADYSKALPKDYEILELPPCTMLYFRGMPFENDEDFCKAIDIVFETIEGYKPELYGYAFADTLAPKFNFGASAKDGAKMAVPVKTL